MIRVMAKVLLIRPSNSGKKKSVENFPMLHRPHTHRSPAVSLQRRAVISRIYEAIIHRARETLINQETLSTDRRRVHCLTSANFKS